MLLLLLPCATIKGITIIDAIFTSTSAVCVTGLIVLDTAADFTLFGRLMILILIQLGGLGIMTFSFGLLSFIGGNISIKWRFAFKDIFSELDKVPIKNIFIKVLKYTFIIEGIISIILFSVFIRDFPIGKAVEHSIFHAVSAFCNAGFSTFSNSLEGYRNNIIVNLSISIAIILGGLGFLVLNELFGIRLRAADIFSQLSIHTRLVIIVSILLISFGMAGILMLELNYSLRDISLGESILISFFHSVTCRTAGFNTIDISALRESTHFLIIILMFIGGSPGSIAGGIKTTTIAAIALLIFSKLKGRNQTILWGRALDRDTIDKSTTLIILSIIFLSISIFLMLIIRDFDIGHSFVSVVFESVSAFGTVGLSMGITTELPPMGKIILSLVMLIGRLGPLALIMAITSNKRNIYIEYPTEHIIIG